ncbi:MAG TPA: ribosome maturation factor RimM [Candidatus Caenarcaniphilales bacterium]|nr:ribosome maturation factor RimM [Candidatus Caenarcaniphilales bacterium]
MTSATDGPTGAGGRLVVGLVRGVHGLRGAVRVEVLTDDEARFRPGSVVHPEGSRRRLTVVEARADRPSGLLVRFEEVRDRSEADKLREQYLEAEPPAEPLGDATYYWHEIIGSHVVTHAGEALGTVHDVFRAGEAEVYVVRPERGPEVLVPAVASVVMELAPREGRIVVDADALGLTDGEESAG